MSFDEFRRSVKSEVFDYLLISHFFRDLKKPRDKISRLLSEKKIVKIKKGLYVFGQEWRSSLLSMEMMANLIYGPSCVSFEYALAHYGLIPERTNVITSLAVGESKEMKTPLGIFEYRAIHHEKFKIGVEYSSLGKEGGYFMASREKAIADLVYRTPGIRTKEQLRFFLFEEMRIDEEQFLSLNKLSFQEIAVVYKKQSVNLIEKLYEI